MSTAEKPRKYVPRPYGLDAEFFHKAIESGLHLQCCDSCGHRQHPPRRFCGSCGSRELGWAPASGRGTLYSWTVSHFTTDPGWVEEVPYATVVVTMDEGPRLVGSWDGDLSELALGIAVAVRVEQVNDDFAYLIFDRRVNRPTDEELGDFYDRYIEAFNRQDPVAFAACFNFPITVLPVARYDERRAGRPAVVVEDWEQFGMAMPERWSHSTIDALVTLGDAQPFVAREGLTAAPGVRAGLIATATRWDHDDRAYQQVQALYLLTREGGGLGVKVLAELAVADL